MVPGLGEGLHGAWGREETSGLSRFTERHGLFSKKEKDFSEQGCEEGPFKVRMAKLSFCLQYSWGLA